MSPVAQSPAFYTILLIALFLQWAGDRIAQEMGETVEGLGAQVWWI